ncbi:MAG: hypothetical protein ABIP97_06975, partial [Chthoniobacterales bacterium]
MEVHFRMIMLLAVFLSYAGMTLYALAKRHWKLFGIMVALPLVLSILSMAGIYYEGTHGRSSARHGIYSWYGLYLVLFVFVFVLSYLSTVGYMLVKKRWRIFLPMFLIPVSLFGAVAAYAEVRYDRERAIYLSGLFDAPVS